MNWYTSLRAFAFGEYKVGRYKPFHAVSGMVQEALIVCAEPALFSQPLSLSCMHRTAMSWCAAVVERLLDNNRTLRISTPVESRKVTSIVFRGRDCSARPVSSCPRQKVRVQNGANNEK